MGNILVESLKRLMWERKQKNRLLAVLLVLSIVVSLNVFFVLRQPGLTLAGDAACGIQEHTHTDACGVQTCICGFPEDVHVHGQSCYEIRIVNSHEKRQLICQETQQPHVHSDGCYQITVTEPLQDFKQICENEDAEHSHEDGCYEIVEIPGNEEKTLVCDLVSEPHEHTESCYEMQTVDAPTEKILVCDEKDAHVHEDACYAWTVTCVQEEHVHGVECYSDENADVETPLEWEEMFAKYPYSGNLRKDLLGIARTQVGYAESKLNFEVGSDGIRHGYTRYGAWYGAPYRDWSAMFVSFCLNYAGADSDEAPGNTGASSMAKEWNKLGKYAPVGEYSPLEGDLVFFNNNTVGIVAEVQNSTFQAICGDVDDTVKRVSLSLADSSITGWGTTEGIVLGEEETLVPAATEEPIVPELPDGMQTEELKAVVDFGEPEILITGTEDAELQDDVIWDPQKIDMIAYLIYNGGEYNFTLVDGNSQKPPKDENGNFIVQPNTYYELALTLNSPQGFLPGNYEYQLPAGLLVNGGSGDFVLNDGTDVGDWSLDENGLLICVLGDSINTHSEVTITANIGVQFTETLELIDSDEKIVVILEKPPEVQDPTKLNKWGSQGSGDKDASKIYWTVYIEGNRDSQIPGSVLTDSVNQEYGDHRYLESDMAGGIKFGVSQTDPETGKELGWHEWTVPADDPNLTWTETGWSYVMPQTATCIYCEEITLGNDGWNYTIQYTSTPVDRLSTYSNYVKIDGKDAYGWGNFSHSESHAYVVKDGSFHADAGGGSFLWEFQVGVPGMIAGQKADYFWYIMDYMEIKNGAGGTIGYVTNDANNATVTAKVNGSTVSVPNIRDASSSDRFAWHDYWSTGHVDGIESIRQIYLLCRCNCTEENCPRWIDGKCDGLYWFDRGDGIWIEKGFCRCWAVPEDVTFTFAYETDDISLIENYGGVGNKLWNEAVLYKHIQQPDGNWTGSWVTNSTDTVTIPGMFKKTLVEDFNGYTANYQITINEAKMALTDGSPLNIHDEMTETLAYISGSLVITAEDAEGNRTTLHQDEDYTVTYDGTGNVTGDSGEPVHVLDIVILRPQPVMYLLDYDATLIIPVGTTQGVEYSNSATVTLWGRNITADTEEKVYTNINISAKNYRVEVNKTAGHTGDPLSGATFGLFNNEGGLITSGVTDAQGELLFETNIIQGIVLREHVLYYMQEMQAPPGYQLSDQKYWFCFCNNKTDYCATCNQVTAGTDAFRIPFEQIGTVRAQNELLHYDLPATGGSGIYPLMLASVMFVVMPLVYGSIRRRKPERRKAS